jgi:hypothetical protein
LLPPTQAIAVAPLASIASAGLVPDSIWSPLPTCPLTGPAS